MVLCQHEVLIIKFLVYTDIVGGIYKTFIKNKAEIHSFLFSRGVFMVKVLVKDKNKAI
jgi:hypothetical protein